MIDESILRIEPTKCPTWSPILPISSFEELSISIVKSPDDIAEIFSVIEEIGRITWATIRLIKTLMITTATIPTIKRMMISCVTSAMIMLFAI